MRTAPAIRFPRTLSTAAAAAIVVAALATNGTGPAHAAAKSCGFEFTWTQPSVIGAQILGRGVAQCDVPPDEHRLVLALEYKKADRWETASSITDETRPPAPPGHAAYEVSAACYAGTWRVSMSVTGSIQGNPFVYSDHTGTRDVPTSQCPTR